MASNPKSILFFLFVLTLISTNNSFESKKKGKKTINSSKIK